MVNLTLVHELIVKLTELSNVVNFTSFTVWFQISCTLSLIDNGPMLLRRLGVFPSLKTIEIPCLFDQNVPSKDKMGIFQY